MKLGNLVMGDFVSFLPDRYESFPRWIGVNYGTFERAGGERKRIGMEWNPLS